MRGNIRGELVADVSGVPGPWYPAPTPCAVFAWIRHLLS